VGVEAKRSASSACSGKKRNIWLPTPTTYTFVVRVREAKRFASDTQEARRSETSRFQAYNIQLFQQTLSEEK